MGLKKLSLAIVAVRDLKARGVEVSRAPYDPGHGDLLADIRDPEGNFINLFERVG